VSSGLGGVFPAGLPVARISGIRREPNQLLAQVRAMPAGACRTRPRGGIAAVRAVAPGSPGAQHRRSRPKWCRRPNRRRRLRIRTNDKRHRTRARRERPPSAFDRADHHHHCDVFTVVPLPTWLRHRAPGVPGAHCAVLSIMIPRAGGVLLGYAGGTGARRLPGITAGRNTRWRWRSSPTWQSGCTC